jgi:hypothetical protein
MTATWLKFLTATDTNLNRPYYIFIAAIFRTVFNLSMRSPARIKTLATIITGRRAALVAELTGSGTRFKFLSASSAFNNQFSIWKQATINQVGIVFPKFVIGCGMARRAKRNQIIQLIRRLIIFEKKKRFDVMNGQAHFNKPAFLAGIIIPRSNFLGLRFPVRASIARMTAAPSRIIRAGHSFSTPFFKAFSTAKIMLVYLAWPTSSKIFTASIA